MNPIARLIARFAPKEHPKQETPPAPETGTHAVSEAEAMAQSAPEPQAAPKAGPQPTPEARRPLSIPERRENLISFAVGRITPDVEAICEGAPFSPVGIGVRFPGTENICQIVVEPSARHPQRLALTARAFRKGTDLAISHFIRLDASKADIIAFLKSKEGLDELQKSFIELSDSVDEKW